MDDPSGTAGHGILDIFRSECAETCARLEAELHRIEGDPSSCLDALSRLKRDTHRLKGAALLSGLRVTAAMVDDLDDCLDSLRSSPTSSNRHGLLSIHDCLDGIRALSAFETGDDVPAVYIGEK